MIIIFGLLVCLILLDRTIKHHASSIAHYQRVRGSILLYFGRVVIATLLMALIYAKYQLGIIGDYEIRVGMALIILA